MRKILMMIAILTLLAGCSQEISNELEQRVLTLTGYNNTTRTTFGEPSASQIPFLWSAGDYIWVGSYKSSTLAEDCKYASFTVTPAPSVVGSYQVFYNITGESNKAVVPASQSQNGKAINLGANGDFGYAETDEFGTFCLAHKCAYVWFAPTTSLAELKVSSITLSTTSTAIAGKATYDYLNDSWSTVSEGTQSITLTFDEPRTISATSEGIFAAMVLYPANLSGEQVTILYTFADGSTYTEQRNGRTLAAGETLRITADITEVVSPEPELTYELRVLTFEDKDAKFEPFYLEYANNYEGKEIKTWSDLIDSPQYMGPLTYGNDQMDAMYWWYDEGNTELMHIFPDNYAFCFWGGGHAISNYWGEGYADEDRNKHIAKYYGQDYVDQWEGQPGADAFLGWFNVQMMVPLAPHSGENFVTHYGYKDAKSYIENLPEIYFADGEARVIDHMYVTNTNYTLNQLYNGVKSEEGNNFGGNWSGLTEDAWLKIAAYGFDDIEADAYTEPISQVEFYLVKGENVVTDWQKWDLSGLGKVAKVRFNFLYSEEMGGNYGFTIPGYFAYDDIAVRFDK